ncbi:MAG: hypothetical protein KGY61_13670 [Desulfobacterales bacterium]|nr:hypothetical protein [Desulfobacterales bacterium]
MTIEAYGWWVELQEAKIAADEWNKIKNQDPCASDRNNPGAIRDRQNKLQDFISESNDVIEKGGEVGLDVVTDGIPKITKKKDDK